MAFASTSIIQCDSAGDDTNNAGLFDPANASMATDLAATSATGSSPVVTSASYTFVAGDVGHYLYLKSGTNWTPGWYRIASVSAGAATLDAAIGNVWLSVLNLPVSVSTVAGCATTASPTAGTWTVDYSINSASRYTFTDLVIDGTTNTKFTSAANPVGVNFVGNAISVTSGTGFTAQRVQVVSVSGTTATCDKSLGTLSSTGGNGRLGGALASPGLGSSLAIASHLMMVKAATYTVSNSSNVAGGRLTYGGKAIVGYSTNRTLWNTDTKPVLQPSANSVTIFTQNNDSITLANLEFAGNSKTSITAITGFVSNNAIVHRCKISGVATGVSLNQVGVVVFCDVSASTSAITTGIGSVVYGCDVHDGSGITIGSTGGGGQGGYVAHTNVYNITAGGAHGISLGSNCQAIHCTVDNLTGATAANGIHFSSGNNGAQAINCVCTGIQPVSGNGYGFGAAGGVTPSFSNRLINCAGYNNKTANYDPATLPVGLNLGFVALSGLPYPGSGNFAPNATAGAGALLRAAGILGLFPAGTTTGYPDIGSAQHADPAAAGGLLIHPGMAGGMRG